MAIQSEVNLIPKLKKMQPTIKRNKSSKFGWNREINVNSQCWHFDKICIINNDNDWKSEDFVFNISAYYAFKLKRVSPLLACKSWKMSTNDLNRQIILYLHWILTSHICYKINEKLILITNYIRKFGINNQKLV